MRFSSEEAGAHELVLQFRNSKGIQLMPEMKARFVVKVAANRASVAVNMVLNINKLKIGEFGNHEIALLIDGAFHSSIPLTVARATRNRIRGTMDN